MVRDCSFDNIRNKNGGSSFSKAKKSDNFVSKINLEVPGPGSYHIQKDFSKLKTSIKIDRA